MFCQHCGSPSGPDDVFCKTCGQPLQQSDPAGQPPAAPQAPPVAAQPPPVAPQAPLAPPQPLPVAPQPQPAAQPKKKTGLIIGISVAVVVVLALGVFLATRVLGKRIQEETTETTSRERPTVTEAVLEPLALGETGLHGGLALTVDEISRPDPDYLYGEAQEGFEHILVWLTVENRAKKEKEVPDASQFFLVDDAGSVDDRIGADQDTYYNNEDALKSGVPLETGEWLSGWLLFQKPKDLKTVSLHYHAGRISKEADLVFTFLITLDDLPDPDDPDPTSSETTTEPSEQDLDLFDYLPGQWVSMPDEDHDAYIVAFTEDGMLASSFASSVSETNLDRWLDQDVWFLDVYYWQGWFAFGNELVIDQQDAASIWYSVEAVNDDQMILTDIDTQDTHELFRVGLEPTMAEYLNSTWVPDEPDDEGIYAALSFDMDGVLQVTGSVKTDDDATIDDWSGDGWELIGSFEGSWWLEDDLLMIDLDGTTDPYTIVRYGPDQMGIYQDDAWSWDFTRVGFPMLVP